MAKSKTQTGKTKPKLDPKYGRNEKGHFAKGNQIQRLTAKDILGNNKKYETPEDLLNKALEYFEYIDNNPSVSHEITTTNKGSQTTKEIYKKNPYTIDGLCVFLKLTTLKHYRKRSEFLPVFNYIDKVIYNQKFSGATRGDFSATIIARDLGLVDKTDNKNENTNTNTEMTPEERDRRIKELEKKMKRK